MAWTSNRSPKSTPSTAAAAPAISRSARWIGSLLFGIRATDPATLAEAAAMLLAVALFGAWVPARRAAKVDPMVALRYE